MTQIVPVKEQIQTVRDLLEKSKTQIAIALPRHMNADRMLRVAMTTLQRTPKLLECTPVSFVGAIMQSAQLGLECDGVLGHAYIIPYWNKNKKVFEASFQPGYKGLLVLARRSGDLGPVDARVVHARDFFEYEFGLEPKLRHKPSSDEERGEVTHAYAIVKLKDGTAQFEVMTAWEIEAHRQQYSRATSDDTPWMTSWDSMACKTVLKKTLKLSPASIEVQRAIALDEHIDAGVPQDLTAIAVTELALDPAPDTPTSTLDALTEKLKEPAGAETPIPTFEEIQIELDRQATAAKLVGAPETHFDDGPPMRVENFTIAPPPNVTIAPPPNMTPAEQVHGDLNAEITELRKRLKLTPERFYGLARTHCGTTVIETPDVTTAQLIKLRHALLLLEKRETT